MAFNLIDWWKELAGSTSNPSSFYSTLASGTPEAIMAIGTGVAEFWSDPQENLSNVIMAMSAEIKLMRYKIRAQLAEWMENDVVFWSSIVAIGAIALFAPSISAWFTTTNAWVYVKIFNDQLPLVIGDFLATIGYTQAYAAHQISLIVFDDYRKFWEKIDGALAGLAEELYLGVGTINTLAINIRNLYFSTYTLIGLEPDYIETMFYQDFTDFTSRVTARIERYVVNPQLIFSDVQTELVNPALTRMSELGKSFADWSLKINDKVQLLVDNANKVREDLNSLINDLPDEIGDVIKDKLKEPLSTINTWFEDKILPWSDKIDAVTQVILNTVSNVEEAVYQNRLTMDMYSEQLLGMLPESYNYDDETRELLDKLIGNIIGPGLDKDNIDLLNRVNSLTQTIEQSLVIPESKEPIYSQGKISIDFSKTPVVTGGWNVGEY